MGCQWAACILEDCKTNTNIMLEVRKLFWSLVTSVLRYLTELIQLAVSSFKTWLTYSCISLTNKGIVNAKQVTKVWASFSIMTVCKTCNINIKTGILNFWGALCNHSAQLLVSKWTISSTQAILIDLPGLDCKAAISNSNNWPLPDCWNLWKIVSLSE